MTNNPALFRRQLSRRALLALGGATTVATVTGWGPASAVTATPQLALDFENGSLGAPITTSSGATLSQAYAYTGSYGCRLDPLTTSNNVACLVVNRSGFALGKPYVTFSMLFRLANLPQRTDTYMNLFEIGTTSTAVNKSQFTVFFRDNRLKCDFNWDEVMDLGPMPSVGTWHLLQAVVYFGGTTYTAQVNYNNSGVKTLTSANNKSPESVKVLWVHYPETAVDYTMDVDDIQMATSDPVPEFFPVPSSFVAPVTALANVVTPFGESFEGGLVGTAATAANTTYDESIGDKGVGDGSIAAVFASSGISGNCVKFYNKTIASNAFGFLGKRVDSNDTIYLRRYYRLGAYPTSRMSVLLAKYDGSGNGQLGGTHNGSFGFAGNGSRKFALVNNNNTCTVSQSIVPLNDWFRVEAKLDFTSGTGIQTIRLFLGSNRSGTVPDETLTGPLTGTYTDYIEDGILTNPNTMLSLLIDEAVNGSDWVGPAL